MALVLDFRLTQGDFLLDLHERLDTRALALLGPSGAGKTTILDAIAGLRHPTEGEIRIDGHVLYSSRERIDLPPRRRRVGYVPQDVALFPHFDVRGNIFYAARRDRHVAADRILKLLEIEGLPDRRVDGLSGGERQRVALARALMASPDILLLDEPLAAVDVELRRRILPYLVRVRDELRVPLVYVSHDEQEARSVADRVLILDRGRVKSSHPVAS